MGRDGRAPAYPELTHNFGGAYEPDEPTSTDIPVDGRPIPFAEGCLTDGVAAYDHKQKPIPSYCYWTKRKQGLITFDIGAECRVRRVRVNVLIKPGVHGTKRISLRAGGHDGPELGLVDPAANGWNEFTFPVQELRRFTLTLTALEGARYTTLSEVEAWGEPVNTAGPGTEMAR
jgi:hypothetical protein